MFIIVPMCVQRVDGGFPTEIMFFIRSGMIVLLIAALNGCAANSNLRHPGQSARSKNSVVVETPDVIAGRLKYIAEAVKGRNRIVEKDPRWMEWSYSGIGIRKLNDIPAEKYSDYSRYVDGSRIYVIVHPAYYIFFNKDVPAIRRTADNAGSSIFDLFLRETPDDSTLIRCIRQQQMNEKDFIEYLSGEKRLIILIVPKDYREHPDYRYRYGRDEYARYINEVTSGSESALYLESASPSSGELSADDYFTLLSFMNHTGAKSVLIGGGYVGRCQTQFYRQMTRVESGGSYFIVPEISVFSPQDMADKNVANCLKGNELNFQAVSDFIASDTDGSANIRHLPVP